MLQRLKANQGYKVRLCLKPHPPLKPAFNPSPLEGRGRRTTRSEGVAIQGHSVNDEASNYLSSSSVLATRGLEFNPKVSKNKAEACLEVQREVASTQAKPTTRSVRVCAGGWLCVGAHHSSLF